MNLAILFARDSCFQEVFVSSSFCSSNSTSSGAHQQVPTKFALELTKLFRADVVPTVLFNVFVSYVLGNFILFFFSNYDSG